MKQTSLFLTALFAITALSFQLGASGVRAAGGPCVNPGGQNGCSATIQSAVDAAKAGDTILVAAGTYTESVAISKPLTLQGAGAQLTIIDATGLANGITVQGVTTGPVTITGFEVEHADREGILVSASSHIMIAANLVEGNDKARVAPITPGGMGTCPGAAPFDGDDCGEGLHLQGVSESVVTNNVVEDNVGGILLTDETGPTFDNWITNNIAKDNTTDCGITLASHPAGLTPPQGPPPAGYGVYGNHVEDNISLNNGAAGIGIFAPTPGTGAYDNDVFRNTVIGNGLGGVTIHSHSPQQNLNDNEITYNLISDNAGDEDAGAGPSGIVVFADAKGGADPITGTEIDHNRINDEDNGIWIGTNATVVDAHFNDFAGTAVGINNAGTGTVDAHWNYWGCTTGTDTAGCVPHKGAVEHDTWLTSPPSVR